MSHLGSETLGVQPSRVLKAQASYSRLHSTWRSSRLVVEAMVQLVHQARCHGNVLQVEAWRHTELGGENMVHKHGPQT